MTFVTELTTSMELVIPNKNVKKKEARPVGLAPKAMAWVFCSKEVFICYLDFSLTHNLLLLQVCCTFTVGCGDTVSENSTYFESNNAASGACNTKVCRCDKNICQMRLDFTTFQIADPTTATTTVTKTVYGLQDAAGVAASAKGRCDTDSFSVVVPGGSSPPVICGTNTNQHSMCYYM